VLGGITIIVKPVVEQGRGGYTVRHQEDQRDEHSKRAPDKGRLGELDGAHELQSVCI
jgi:hypothetical protein